MTVGVDISLSGEPTYGDDDRSVRSGVAAAIQDAVSSGAFSSSVMLYAAAVNATALASAVVKSVTIDMSVPTGAPMAVRSSQLPTASPSRSCTEDDAAVTSISGYSCAELSAEGYCDMYLCPSCTYAGYVNDRSHDGRGV